MPCIYKEALDRQAKVGDGECVTLIKHFTKAGWAGLWKRATPFIVNKSSPKRAMLCAVIAASAHLAVGAEFKIDCPAEIANSSVRIVHPPGGWHASVVAPVYLHNAAPLDGPPEELGVLMGEPVRQTKEKWVTRYPLTGPFPKGKWFTCDYGMLNEISLSKRLPDDTRECTVTGRKGKLAGQNAFDITCRN